MGLSGRIDGGKACQAIKRFSNVWRESAFSYQLATWIIGGDADVKSLDTMFTRFTHHVFQQFVPDNVCLIGLAERGSDMRDISFRAHRALDGLHEAFDLAACLSREIEVGGSATTVPGQGSANRSPQGRVWLREMTFKLEGGASTYEPL